MLYNKKRAAEPPQSLGHTVISLLLLLSAWKDEREAPKTCKSNEGKDDPCDEIRSAVKDRGNDVEIKKTDASPIYRADGNQNKGDFIKCIHSNSVNFLIEPFDSMIV